MAYLRRNRVGLRTYYYIVKVVQRGGRYREKVLESLGRDPDPAKVERALQYWKVRTPRDNRRMIALATTEQPIEESGV